MMGYKVKIEHLDSENHAIHRVDDDGDDYIVLIGNNEFLQKLSNALKDGGFQCR